jgi:hypothetical protein
MKTTIVILGTTLALAMQLLAQGRILFVNNSNSLTRLWSLDGPLAGPGIWAQMLAGPTAQSLSPVGAPAEHVGMGFVRGVGSAIIEVPTVPCNTLGYAQMVVWDGRLWGTDYASVPANQLGATDVVAVWMNCFPYPAYAPPFSQPAIVPIPEPPAWALWLPGGALVIWLRDRRQCAPWHRSSRPPGWR